MRAFVSGSPVKSLAAIAFAALSACLAVSCATQEPVLREMDLEAASRLQANLPDYPQARFVVFSDPHLYDPSLGTDGQALQDYLLDDRKLLVESVEILEEVVRNVAREEADFLIIPGDLTKDGERLSHELMAGYLAELERKGLPVYVVPGNHDIANPHACRYRGEETEAVESVSSGEFREVYSAFGFAEAVSEDPDSLSYVAEPMPGLLLFALDSCRYRENDEHPVTGGRFYPATLDWLQDELVKAALANKAVMAVMHHGIVEHYDGQAKFHADYVVQDYEALSRLFAQYGVRVVFTGHYHAQDVTRRSWEQDDRFLFDIETGSLATPPCPYRLVEISGDQRVTIESRFVRRTDSHPEDFAVFSREYLVRGLEEVVVNTVRRYMVSERSARVLAPQVARALEAHYSGDEIPPSEILSLKGIGPWGRVIARTRRYFLEGLWNDLDPPDNRLVINLKDGSWE